MSQVLWLPHFSYYKKAKFHNLPSKPQNSISGKIWRFWIKLTTYIFLGLVSLSSLCHYSSRLVHLSDKKKKIDRKAFQRMFANKQSFDLSQSTTPFQSRKILIFLLKIYKGDLILFIILVKCKINAQFFFFYIVIYKCQVWNCAYIIDIFLYFVKKKKFKLLF